jgi:uncharacterized membrane-anchored protein YhcB (DUF1043 family)
MFVYESKINRNTACNWRHYSQRSGGTNFLELSMDLLTLFIGLIVGILVGFAIAWFWTNSMANSQQIAVQSTEVELKNLLAQQAQSHLQTSRESIQALESELERLLASVTQYESTLSNNTEEYTQNNFFGEHASMFLRNTDSKSKKVIAAKHPDNQPKDFANSGSGVFVGSVATDTVNIKEKSNN